MAAVEHRDRQQIQHAQIDAQHRQEPQEVAQPLLRLLSGHLRDHDRPAEVARRDIAGDHLIEREQRQFRIFVGLLNGAHDGLPGVALFN
jgi:hypothetical protein